MLQHCTHTEDFSEKGLTDFSSTFIQHDFITKLTYLIIYTLRLFLFPTTKQYVINFGTVLPLKLKLKKINH